MNLLQELGSVFKKPNNHLMQLITVMCGLFVVFSLVDVASSLSGLGSIQLENKFFSLSAFLPNMLRQPWTLLSYGFVHGGIWHLVFNMLFLFWFGQLVVEFLGSSRVFSIFVLGVLAGGFTYLAIYNLLPYFGSQLASSQLVGASGGIFAIVWAAATLLPDYGMRLLFLGDVKIKYIALFYTLLSLIQLNGANAGGNLAHLGGAAMGVIYLKMLNRGRDIGTWAVAILNLFKKQKKRPFRRERPIPSFTYSKGQSGSVENPTSTHIDQSEVDRLLDKIGLTGYDSLTKDEKQRLFKASQQ